MLQHAYLVAKIGVHTAENEPLEVWLIYVDIIQYYSFVSLTTTAVLKLATALGRPAGRSPGLDHSPR